MISARLIEVVGMPGSGKSTVLPLVRQAILAEGMPVEAPVELRRGEAEAHLRRDVPDLAKRVDPYLAEIVVRRVRAGHGTAEKMDRVVREVWFSKLHAVREAANSTSIVLFEEGMIHECWRMAHLLRGTGLDRTFLKEMWPHMITARTVIELVALPETRHDRMRTKRSLGPVNRELAAAGPQDRLWQDTERLYRRLARRAVRFRRGRLVTVDNDVDGAPQRAVEQILTVLRDRVRGAGAL